MAHPVRVRLVGLLRSYGPLTATRLAERMGLTSGSTSYHLRQLAAAGFVTEDVDRGNARERWWRAVHETTWVRSDEPLAQEPEATLTYLHSVAASYAQRVQRAVAEFETLPMRWRESADMSDWALRLTPEEARRLREELWAILARYRWDRAEERSDVPQGAARVSVITQILPELDVPPPGDGPAAEEPDAPGASEASDASGVSEAK
ncbi:helix-turn-helix domain-containing protein [Streptomyces sp. TRM70308]|uniref:helix-turn-helix domain-containing protein n=1 Tax=Streptomyces sp. TRM70308 TaxID=3131932 RepID=UPI003CFBD6D9